MRCHDCGTPLRPSRRTLEERPGTVLHHGRGLCQPYHARRRQNGTIEKLPVLRRTRAEVQDGMSADEAERVRYNKAEFVKYIKARREEWPADGSLDSIVRRVEGLEELR